MDEGRRRVTDATNGTRGGEEGYATFPRSTLVYQSRKRRVSGIFERSPSHFRRDDDVFPPPSLVEIGGRARYFNPLRSREASLDRHAKIIRSGFKMINMIDKYD